MRPPFSLGQLIFRLTDWLVLPLRRALPGLGGQDWASLIGACLITLAAIAIQLGVRSAFTLEAWLLLSLLSVVHTIAYSFIGSLILEFILILVNPHPPISPTVRALTDALP